MASDQKQRRSSFDQPPRNEQWGTVAETTLGLGKQKMAREAVEATVERLSAPRDRGVPDSDRTVGTGALKQSGIANSYAWKGY